MIFRISFLATCAILILVSGSCAPGRLFAQDDTSWKERFLKEAPPAWEKYRKRAKRIQGSFKRTTIRLGPTKRGEVLDRDWSEIKQRNDCALFLRQGDFEEDKPPRTAGIVMGINDRYGFELSRKTPTAAWIVSNLDVDLRDGMQYRFATSDPRETGANWTTCPITLFLIPYPSKMIPHFSGSDTEDTGITLKRVTPINRNDRQAVKVEFDFHPRTENTNAPTLQGWVHFDPQRFWVIHEFNVQRPIHDETNEIERFIAGTTVVSYEYEEAQDSFPLPKRVTRRFTPLKGVDREDQYEFDLKEAKVPESDFTLSAFGLPEPPGMQRRWQPWYLWCAIAGMVCLTLAVLLRRLRRRGSSSG